MALKKLIPVVAIIAQVIAASSAASTADKNAAIPADVTAGFVDKSLHVEGTDLSQWHFLGDPGLTDDSDDQNMDDEVESDQENDGEEEDENGIFFTPRKAKTLLRVRRGWSIKRLWGEEQDEERESRRRRERAAENARRERHNRFCRANCWGGWQAWSGCSTPCGSSGSRTRRRHHAPPAQCRGYVNSHGCQGPATQQDACNRSCRNGGSLRSTDCSCPAAFTGRCCENRVTCGFPGRPSHGTVSPGGSSHFYGVTAQFACDVGYTLQGSASRTCQGNGQWSGSVPTCTIRSCVDPGIPPHSTRSGNSFVYNARVVYTCERGYTMVGTATRVCQANGHWTPSAPTCQPVDCGAPPTPSQGSMTSTGTVYQNAATFSCNEGFYLEGSSRRVCQANGQWDGAPTTCTQITCLPLPAPTFGEIQPVSNGPMAYGTSVEFSCVEGYNLQGSNTRTCLGSGLQGVWSGTQPTCSAVDCGNPGTPTNGAKQGGVYTYSSNVTFKCQPGYKMNGAGRIQCQADGLWSSAIPTCEACQVNSYKPGLNNLGECVSCPANSHTLSTASDDIQRCVCNEGFRGSAGVCTEILCPTLSSPAHASIGSCDNHVGESCHMTCVGGHIRVDGNEVRQCHSDGSWSGQDLVCQACPVNTYKSETGSCEQCPDNSRTTGTGNSLTGCVCSDGFEGPAGGPCQDLDECSSDANCSQTCVNTYGSFHCDCHLPGFILDNEDRTSCISSNQCPALETPDNGGLVCLQSQVTNTQRCSVRCNPGFEHLIRTNEFEECGPSTNWRWSNEIDDIPILPCVEQHFTGVVVEAEAAYFVSDCEAITDDQKTEIAQQFVTGLEDNGVCVDLGEAVCNIEDVSIECGAMTDDDYYYYDDEYYDTEDESRLKRSVEDTVVLNQLKVKFKLAVPQRSQQSVNCSQFCPESHLHNPRCQERCRQHHENASQNILQSATSKLQQLFGSNVVVETPIQPAPTQSADASTVSPRPSSASPTRPNFQTIRRGGSIFFVPSSEVEQGASSESASPSPDGDTRYLTWFAPSAPTINIPGLTLRPLAGFKKSAIQHDCEAGMIFHDNICVPCPPGSHLPSGENECVQCPRGTYQPDHQQTECLPCGRPTGRGSMHCPRPPPTTTSTTSASSTTTPPRPRFIGESIFDQAHILVNRFRNITVSVRVPNP